MPFCLIEDINFNEVRIAIIQNNPVSDSDFSFMTENEKVRFENFSSEKRKREFIGIIRLKNHLFTNEEISYTENGAPYLVNSEKEFISISHSYIYIGIAAAPFNIGLDIELISGKAAKLSPKFMNAREMLSFDISSPEETTRIWTIKEVIYKIACCPGLDFKEDIHVRKESDRYFADVRIEGKWFTTEIITFVKDNYIMSFNQKALVQK